MRIWDKFLTPLDKQVFEAAGYGMEADLGVRPALLVIDVLNGTVGDKPEPILESIKKYRLSCGERGWEAIHRIKEFLETARATSLPIIYSTIATRSDGRDIGRWAAKNRRTRAESEQRNEFADQIVREVAPRPEDFIIPKLKPSIFYGTPLLSLLRSLEVDTLLVTGATTSGCVRSTVIDAFSMEYKIAVVEDCIYDRGEASHAITLFDLHAKYANVISLQRARDYLSDLPSRQAASSPELLGQVSKC